jgi:8-oxo-dGTP pyrophosphatase MutT (NUDIX family)
MYQIETDRRDGYRPCVGLLLIKDGQILIGKGAGFLTAFASDGENIQLAEAQPDWKYGWGIPQGGIEINETPWQAIRREADEEIGDDWPFEMVGRNPFYQTRMNFPVNKDGRTYCGKSYHFYTLEVVGEPIGYSDWVFGHHFDEDPLNNPYPAPEFPGGIVFMRYTDAVTAVTRYQRGRKGQLILEILYRLRGERMIRA